MKSKVMIKGIVLGLAVLWAVSLPAQNVSAGAASNESERFLVVVETSAAMQSRTDNVLKVVGNVIHSGLRGQVQSGNTIGLWTFDERLYTGQFPLRVWTPDNRESVARAVVNFLGRQEYSGKANLNQIWEAATNVVARSRHITLLLITSGAEPVVGTPFDAAIGENFKRNYEDQKKADMPFLTILRAVDGRFVNFAVTMPPWPLEVPDYPEGLAPPPAPEVKVETNIVATTRPKPVLPSPTNIILIGNAQPPPPSNPPAAVSLPGPDPVQSNPVAVEIPSAVSTEIEDAEAVANRSASFTETENAEAVAIPSAPARRGVSMMEVLLLVAVGLGFSVLVGLNLRRRRRRATLRQTLSPRSLTRRDR